MTDSDRHDSTGTGDPYRPHEDPQGPSERLADQRLRLTATIPYEDVSGEGMAPELQSDPRGDAEELIYNVLFTGGEQSGSDEAGDFRLLTEELTLDGEPVPGVGVGPIPNRYDILECIGQGANGQVFACFDNSFQREIAVKFLHPRLVDKEHRLERFLREARITGTLDHPNILPLHDMGISDGGLAYFTMRKADGLALDEAINASVELGRPVDAIAGLDERVDIMIKVCDAVAYAHSRGVVHQDLKPGNILVGRFGEVTVLDWGCAITAEDRAEGEIFIQGTPAYMAPEQARREASDERSDVYCLGTTFFHLLTLRLPTWSDDEKTFWEMKREGVVRPADEEERRQLPTRLLAVAETAMAADPRDRYAGVEALAEDLKRYRAGLSLHAYSDSLGDVLKRIYRQNRAAFRVAAVAVLLLLLGGWFYWQEKQKELTSWRLVAEQDFTSDGIEWLDDWRLVEYPEWRADKATQPDALKLTVEDGALLVDSLDCSYGAVNLICPLDLPGNVRLSYHITALAMGENFNVFIGGDDRFTGYTFHVCGHGNLRSVLLSRGRSEVARVMLDAPLQQGHNYRFVVAKEAGLISLHIDGREILSYRDVAPLAGPQHQRLGFEVQNNRVRIDNIRIERQPLPQKVGAIVAADALFQRGHFAEAAEAYAGVLEHFPGSDMVEQALSQQARSELMLEHFEEAYRLASVFLQRHPESEHRHGVRILAMDALIALDQADALRRVVAAIADDPESPQGVRTAALERMVRRLTDEVLGGVRIRDADAATCWRVLDRLDLLMRRLRARQVRDNTLRAASERLIELGYELPVLERYGDHPAIAARARFALGEYEQALALVEHFPLYWINYNLKLGRYEQVADRYPPFRWLSNRAYLALGRYDALRDHPRYGPELEAEILHHQGDHEGALAIAPGHHSAMILSGRYETLSLADMEALGWSGWLVQEVRIAQGHYEEVFRGGDGLGLRIRAGAHWAIVGIQDGDLEPLRELRRSIEDNDALLPAHKDIWTNRVLPATLSWLADGGPDPVVALQPLLEQDRYHARSTLAHCLRLIETGSDAQVPVAMLDTNERLLCRALHHERRGEADEALVCYREVAKDTGFLVRQFAEWRIAELSAE